MTPILLKICTDQRNMWNQTGSQSLKAETWNTAEILIPVDSMQNSVLRGGVVWGFGVQKSLVGSIE